MEVFKDIAGYEGLYQVSNLGRVKSLGNEASRKEKILKPKTNNKGYQYVGLCKDGKRKYFMVHRLVALAFLEKPLDQNATDVNHKDENKTNNVVVLNADGYVNVEESNLEWCTKEYNNNYGSHNERAARAKIGVYNTKKSKPVLQFTKSGEFVKEWVSIMEVQRVLGINQSNISQCCLGKEHYNSAGGFIWRYA